MPKAPTSKEKFISATLASLISVTYLLLSHVSAYSQSWQNVFRDRFGNEYSDSSRSITINGQKPVNGTTTEIVPGLFLYKEPRQSGNADVIFTYGFNKGYKCPEGMVVSLGYGIYRFRKLASYESDCRDPEFREFGFVMRNASNDYEWYPIKLLAAEIRENVAMNPTLSITDFFELLSTIYELNVLAPTCFQEAADRTKAETFAKGVATTFEGILNPIGGIIKEVTSKMYDEIANKARLDRISGQTREKGYCLHLFNQTVQTIDSWSLPMNKIDAPATKPW